MMVMRSNPVLTFFYFSTQKYFTILFKILDFLRPLDRFKVRIWVIISEIYMAWRKILIMSGGTFVPHPQTVSTSLMPRLVNVKVKFLSMID